MKHSLLIPADVPENIREEFTVNYTALTRGTGNLFMLAADHKMEHLDADTYGNNIDPAAHNPEHFFQIASKSTVGALASQLGLIARYAPQYPMLNYIIKLNSKTNIIPRTERDPLSKQLWSVEQVIALKKNSQLPIRGIGLTIYLGSAYEDFMLYQASNAIYEAHQAGLIAILWIYPRGKAIKDETDWKLLAGAAGVAACLGADFVKLHAPHPAENKSSIELLKLIVEAAGNTKVIIAGGEQRTPEAVLTDLKEQMQHAGISGAALGRNIWQHSLKDAIKLADQIAQIIYDNK